MTPVVYPRPEDGVRDELVVRFWLSKPSKVALVDRRQGGRRLHRERRPALVRGDAARPRLRHARRCGSSRTASTATAAAPTSRSFDVERDTTAPTLSAAKANGRVFWRAKDGESACCKLRLELRGGGKRQVVPLVRTKGSFAIPKGYWSVTAVARDAAGNVTDASSASSSGTPASARS